MLEKKSFIQWVILFHILLLLIQNKNKIGSGSQNHVRLVSGLVQFASRMNQVVLSILEVSGGMLLWIMNLVS